MALTLATVKQSLSLYLFTDVENFAEYCWSLDTEYPRIVSSEYNRFIAGKFWLRAVVICTC